MGVTKDFITATIADALAPTFRRPMEDLIYETLDRRQIPTRTDFKELRDLVHNLRGQVSGSIQSLRSISEQQEAIEDKLDSSGATSSQEPSSIHDQLALLEEKLRELEKKDILHTLLIRIAALEDQQNNTDLLNRVSALEKEHKQLKKNQETLQAQNEQLEKTILQQNKPTICLIDGCDNKVRARGLCANHYKKFQRGTLKGYINSGGKCRIKKQTYVVDKKWEGKPFTHDETNIYIEDQVFLRTDIAQSKSDS